MKIIGIDDAGRGPVIGPMVLAGVLIEEEDVDLLKNLGAKDSKVLLPKKRKEIGEKIKKEFKHHLEIALPEEIDNSSNLNYLEAIKAARIIDELTEDLNENVEVIIDCPSVNIDSWKKDVFCLIKNKENISIRCEHKADANHFVVSAASIIAKEKREEEIWHLKKNLGIDFGSGYPSDPKTKDFIKGNYKNIKYKEIIRFSWDTIKKLIKNEKQEKLF